MLARPLSHELRKMVLSVILILHFHLFNLLRDHSQITLIPPIYAVAIMSLYVPNLLKLF